MKSEKSSVSLTDRKTAYTEPNFEGSGCVNTKFVLLWQNCMEMSVGKLQRWFQLRFNFFKTLMAGVASKEQIMLTISLACSHFPF